MSSLRRMQTRSSFRNPSARFRFWRRLLFHELLVRYAEDTLADQAPPKASVRSRAEKAIAPLLPHGKASVATIARELGMSRRTLARALAAEGLTFSALLDQYRVNLAKAYLTHGDLAISQIAWLLGYREVSAFTHAFKRWTGITPRQSRAGGHPASKRHPGSPRLLERPELHFEVQALRGCS